MKYLYEGNLNDNENHRSENDVDYYIRGTTQVKGCTYERYGVQTHFVQCGENYLDVVGQYPAKIAREGDIMSISEKIIAMCQDHVVKKEDVHLSWAARFMSHFGKKTTSGIGITEPYKLQLMIDMKGLPKVLFAGFVGVIGKLFGKRGLFYKILGSDAAGIDGFYDHSAFDIYHDMAVLMPVNPGQVCQDIWDKYHIAAMIVDANDIDVEILGKSKALDAWSDEDLKGLIVDNPAGQDDECTPFVLIRDITGKEPQKYIPPKKKA